MRSRRIRRRRARLPGLRFSGFVSRAGEYCFMMPELPLAQITPLLSGWSRIAVDVADDAVAQMDADAAAARAHVARRVARFVRGAGAAGGACGSWRGSATWGDECGAGSSCVRRGADDRLTHVAVHCGRIARNGCDHAGPARRRGLNQLSRARRRTTSPTMTSVGPCSAARSARCGSGPERAGHDALRGLRSLLDDRRRRCRRQPVRDELARRAPAAPAAPCRRRSSAADARARASRGPCCRP